MDKRSRVRGSLLGGALELAALPGRVVLRAQEPRDGLLRVQGRAPDGLVFELGVRAGAAPLARYGSGDVALPREEAREAG